MNGNFRVGRKTTFCFKIYWEKREISGIRQIYNSSTGNNGVTTNATRGDLISQMAFTGDGDLSVSSLIELEFCHYPLRTSPILSVHQCTRGAEQSDVWNCCLLTSFIPNGVKSLTRSAGQSAWHFAPVECTTCVVLTTVRR